ncbi:MAG TPA: hypothetical protein PK299_09430 [Anaerolineales bacterium]|nr:hypothetical protein [Anaerolineales bacterium]
MLAGVLVENYRLQGNRGNSQRLALPIGGQAWTAIKWHAWE